jgi:demethylmenaquinone methyltransferase/2-methoxy-6-polyprenyl-1,4-benzoquinol methylase
MMPFPDAAFDCATIGFALRNVVSIADMFREIARVLKPGGKVISVELTQPTSRVLKKLHSIYMWRLVKYIGGLISGNREAYTYLPRSIAEHIAPEEVGNLMQDAGFREVEIHRISFGTATVHVGKKIES